MKVGNRPPVPVTAPAAAPTSPAVPATVTPAALPTFNPDRWAGSERKALAQQVEKEASGPWTPSIPLTHHADVAFDGALVGAEGRVYPASLELKDVPAVTPNNGVVAKDTVVLISGIMTDMRLQASDMQGLANTGVNVLGIHNASRGMAADVFQCLLDKLNLGDNPAVTSAASVMYEALTKGENIHLVGHSQGALIISRALLDVRNRFILEDGLTPEQAQDMLRHVEVETFGGSSNRFIDGPEYTHYVNKLDVIPLLTGVGWDAINPFGKKGKGAVVHVFSDRSQMVNLPKLHPEGFGFMEGLSNFFARAVDRTLHGPQDVYFRHRS